MYYQVSASPLVILQPGDIRVNDIGNGVSTLVRVSDSAVLSCQPNGKFEWRDPGADGAYERCAVSSGVAMYNPEGPSKPAYVFSLQAVPNA